MHNQTLTRLSEQLGAVTREINECLVRLVAEQDHHATEIRALVDRVNARTRPAPRQD